MSLVADIDNADTSADRVLMMTIHSAKGLEFSHVYIVGLEDGLFPGDRAVNAYDPEDMEEERRLAYVGITRAKDDLTLTSSSSRMFRGQWVNFPISRFVKEIPLTLIESNMSLEKKTADTIPMYERKDKSVKLYSGYINQSTQTKTTSNVNKPYSGTNILSSSKPVAKPKINAFKSAGDSKSFSFTKGSDIKNEINYKVGDRVSHIKFGEGTVKDIDSSGVNTYVSIEFDAYGQRVLDTRFAKLNVIG